MREGWGDRFTMGHVNPAASCTLQHRVWAASQYLNSIDLPMETWSVFVQFSAILYPMESSHVAWRTIEQWYKSRIQPTIFYVLVNVGTWLHKPSVDLKLQRSSRWSQLVSTSSRKPSSGVMKIDPRRGDYIAKRCDRLSNDQLMNCEREHSLSWELFWSMINATEGVKELFNELLTCEHILTPWLEFGGRCGRPDQLGQRCEAPL